MDEEEKLECAAREIITYLVNHPKFEKKKITQLKNQIIKKYHFGKTPKNSRILEYVTEDEMELIGHLLRRRSTRTISGVTVVAVMTKPFPCPGKCIYCPGEQSQPGEKAAQSYTGQEPAARRSIMFEYDPYLQTKHRLLDQQAIGHNVDKVELIIMGGTFLSTPIEYQRSFVKNCIDAMNNCYQPDFNSDMRSESLEEAKREAETAKLRFVGLTIETRPDYCKIPHVNSMLNYGATRVEIGIQTTRTEILSGLQRGHSIEDSINAIKFSKDGGLKVNAHIMPNLPGSDLSSELQDFNNLFANQCFRPDMLKIYPTLVIKGTKLYEMWKQGDYESYSLEDTVKIIAEMKASIPKYVRIQRIQRDIPAFLIVDGVKKSNLRQLVQNYMKKHDMTCNCIRCREHGFFNKVQRRKGINKKPDFAEFQIERLDYDASDGKEIFLSFENDNALLGYLRLRRPSQDEFRPEINSEDTMIVREIRVVGELVPKDHDPRPTQLQHRGFGSRLLESAEKIAKEEFDAKKMVVISGIGVREYFYRQGYSLDGVYVAKPL